MVVRRLTVVLTQIIGRREYLKVPWHMQATTRSPFQRIQVIDMMVDPGLYGQGESYIIGLLNLRAMDRGQP